MTEGTFKHDSLQDRESIRHYLEMLQKGFASGSLRLRIGDKVLELDPQEMIEFTLEAKRKGDRRKLSLKFSWKDPEKQPSDDEILIMEAE